MFNSVVVVATVLSVCRPMLRLHSLAATHGVSPSWLLNQAEMSRVRWIEGARVGEILVEVELCDMPPASANHSGDDSAKKLFSL